MITRAWYSGKQTFDVHGQGIYMGRTFAADQLPDPGRQSSGSDMGVAGVRAVPWAMTRSRGESPMTATALPVVAALWKAMA
jgi:hypothetical protein